MKRRLALVLALAFQSQAWAFYKPIDPAPLYSNLSTPGKCHFDNCFDIETVTMQAGKASFESRQALLELFKARNEAIRRKMVLLPGFNLRTYEFIIPSPLDYFANLMPFLFPSHWYNAGMSKLQARAQYWSYIATVSDQRTTAQGLYIAAHQEMMSQKIAWNHITFAEKTLNTLKSSALRGEIPSEDVEELSAFIEKMKSDYALMSNSLVDQNLDIANLLTEVDVENNPGPKEIAIPDMSNLVRTDFKALRKTANEIAPEIKAFNYLIAAARYSKRAVFWDFLTPESIHPDQSGGFQTPSRMRIADAERKEIELQKEQFEEENGKNIAHTKQQVQSATKVLEYAQSIERSIQSVLGTLFTNLDNTRQLDVNRIISLIRDNHSAQQMKNNAVHSLLQSDLFMKRVTLTGSMYQGIESEIPTNWVALSCYTRKENKMIKAAIARGELNLPEKIEFEPRDTAFCIR